MIFILSASIAGFTTSSALPSSFAICVSHAGRSVWKKFRRPRLLGLLLPSLVFPFRRGRNMLNGTKLDGSTCRNCNAIQACGF